MTGVRRQAKIRVSTPTLCSMPLSRWAAQSALRMPNSHLCGERSSDVEPLVNALQRSGSPLPRPWRERSWQATLSVMVAR